MEDILLKTFLWQLGKLMITLQIIILQSCFRVNKHCRVLISLKYLVLNLITAMHTVKKHTEQYSAKADRLLCASDL